MNFIIAIPFLFYFILFLYNSYNTLENNLLVNLFFINSIISLKLLLYFVFKISVDMILST